MNWSPWTGLEAETAEDSRRMFDAFRSLAGGLGRACAVWTAQFALLYALPSEAWAELAMTVTLGSLRVGYTWLDPILLVANAWAFAPFVGGLYQLWQFKREAQQSDSAAVAGGEP